ncbi:MAG: OmcB family cysteine-rich outer membrane protein [Anaerolineae bacterium]
MILRRPRSLADTLYGWLDAVPWWAVVLAALGGLVLLYIISPAHVTATRIVPERSVRAGGRLVYQIEVSNSGPAEAVRVLLSEQLPAAVTFVSAQPAPREQAEGRLTWEVENLSRNEKVTYQVTVTSKDAAEASELIPATAQPQVTWRTVSLDILDFLSLGVRVTVLVTLYSFILAIILGLIGGLGRVTKPPPGLAIVVNLRFLALAAARVAIGLAAYFLLASLVRALPRFTSGLAIGFGLILYLAPVVLHPYTLSTIYVEVFRGVPMLVQVLYLGFVVRPFIKTGLSQLLKTQVEFSEFNAAVLGLGLGYGAYLAEVFRAGIQSIHRGQMEAARSLGMSYAQAMRYIILPQAIRRVLPPLANDGVALLKDSSFVSVLSVADLTRQGRLYMSRTYRAFESWNMVAVSYLVLTFLFSGLARALERKLSEEER